MKKKLIIILLSCLMLTGCEDVEPTGVQAVSREYSSFELIVDASTGIVYIDNTVCNYDGNFRDYTHIYTPYYSRNGKLCRFVDGKVVEIE